MDLSQQSITGRQFDMNRRGYDPEAVDSHLTEIATAVADRERRIAELEATVTALEAKVQDADESGLPNVEIRLLDATENVVTSTTSDSSGIYLFQRIIPGDYYLEFIAPPGFVFSPQDQGGNDALDSDPDPVTGRTSLISSE